MLDEAPGVRNLRADFRLSFLQHIDRQRVSHVGIDEFLLVSFELGQATSLVGNEATT
ncbi:hypothetical protein [Nocardioides acrostichi]|uniref:Uncharacterized protein n=1 Tax=Nocardioides acrostichi TaxID=2784339 RepID=A0A930Y7K4_9ACTN|nr:hypothetical protein [Nocardioides acrostichi]MBF4163520.1 hypothetical protein [Nocardioides acrostichi]